jgi:hypothetical protein
VARTAIAGEKLSSAASVRFTFLLGNDDGTQLFGLDKQQ